MTQGLQGSDPELALCIEAFTKAFKRKNPPIKKPLRDLINILSPILVAAPDPRIKALGLALQAASMTFLSKSKGVK